jgi:hypothetical protein
LYNFQGHFGYKQKTSLRKTSLQRQAWENPKGRPNWESIHLGKFLKKHPSIGKPGRNPESGMKEVNYESKQLGSLYQQTRRWPYEKRCRFVHQIPFIVGFG